MNHNNILSIIVTYYPEEKALKDNVRAFIDNVDKVLIWENTPVTEKLYYRFLQHDKIEYCGDGVNSISRALNYAWKYAKSNGYEYLLTVDQDSLIVDFPLYINKTIKNIKAPIGIWTPRLQGRYMEEDFKEIVMPITSGMLIPIMLLNMIGGWDETFEVDSVDDEFTLHAHSIGIKTYVVKDAVLIQKFGGSRIVHLWGHSLNIRNYPASRLYNIFKNNIILIRRYPDSNSFKRHFFESWVGYIKFIIIFETEKFEKMKAIVRGCIKGAIMKK